MDFNALYGMHAKDKQSWKLPIRILQTRLTRQKLG